MSRGRRFSNRQITAMVIAACAAIVLAPAGAIAATNAVSIADPTHPTRRAHVDAGGRLSVGDGGGALTVNGSVLTYPSAHAFTRAVYLSGGSTVLLKPGLSAGTKIMLTGVTISPNGGGGQFARAYVFKQYDASATCTGGHGGEVWYYAATAAWPNSFSASFASPVVVTDRCAQLTNLGSDSAYFVITGYTS